MQYLLTEVEFHNLTNKESEQVDLIKKDLQDVCTYAADTVPILFWERTTPAPWGCILTTSHEHCCDECPVENQCPYDDKQWSK